MEKFQIKAIQQTKIFVEKNYALAGRFSYKAYRNGKLITDLSFASPKTIRQELALCFGIGIAGKTVSQIVKKAQKFGINIDFFNFKP